MPTPLHIYAAAKAAKREADRLAKLQQPQATAAVPQAVAPAVAAVHRIQTVSTHLHNSKAEAEGRRAAALAGFDRAAADAYSQDPETRTAGREALALAQTGIDKADTEVRALDSAIRIAEARHHAERVQVQQQRRDETLARFTSLLVDRDAAAIEQEQAITAAVAAFRSLLDINDKLAKECAAHGVIPPAGIFGGLVLAISHELFRQSAQPDLLGGTGGKHSPSFPGSHAPTIQLSGQPEKVTALSVTVAQTSAFLAHHLKVEFSKPIVLSAEAPHSAVPSTISNRP